MLYRAIFDVCSEMHTRYINAHCGQSVELLNDKRDVLIATCALLKVNSVFGDFLLSFQLKELPLNESTV
jgi:hypothetical protein